MVEQFNDLSPESRCLQGVHQFWNHTLIIHLNSNFLIKGKVEEGAKGDLEEQRVIAGNESIQLLNDSLILHFILVLSKDAEFL